MMNLIQNIHIVDFVGVNLVLVEIFKKGILVQMKMMIFGYVLNVLMILKKCFWANVIAS